MRDRGMPEPGPDHRMPDFTMPEAADEPAAPVEATPRASAARPALTAEPEASAALEPPRRLGLGWRHVLLGALLGAVVGATIPAGAQFVERAAAGADADSVRAVAVDYLAAIAEGRAADATALVPLPARTEAVPDAVLQAATRIDAADVQSVRIDGDAASVGVQYSLGSVDVERSLMAERVDGSWSITTSLAEPVQPMFYGLAVDLQLAGFPLTSQEVRLYPGLYTLDEVSGPIMHIRSDRFSVDGDPSTVTELLVDAQLAPEAAAHAGAVGLAVAQECQAAQPCQIPADAELEQVNSYVFSSDAASIDVSVQLMAGVEQQWYEVRMRVVTDERGMPEEWLCLPFGDEGIPSEPCPEV